VSLLVSPLVIAVCRRKSTRVTAVIGGLVAALGCLFSSFASQFHQLFFSYGAIIGKMSQLLQLIIFWGVSNPLCLSSSSALHFFQLFFLGPPPC
jgi:hypothetical protein